MISISKRLLAKAGMAAAFSGVLAFGALASASAAGNLVTDGDFETTPAASFTEFNGGANFSGWAVGGDSVDLIGTYWTSASGAQSLDLNGAAPGSVSQTLATVVGQQYTLSFSLAGNPVVNAPDPAIKGLTVTAGSDLSKSLTFDTTGHTTSDLGWITKSYTFTASSTSTVLSFASTIPGHTGAAIDNVSVTATPEAGTIVAFGLMLLGGAVFMLRSGKTSKSSVLA